MEVWMRIHHRILGNPKLWPSCRKEVSKRWMKRERKKRRLKFLKQFQLWIIDWIQNMATLSQVLNFDLLNSDSNDSDSSSLTCIPPANSHLVITDTLESPATFYLIHSISDAINNDIPLLYISTDGNGIANLNSICNKSVSNKE